MGTCLSFVLVFKSNISYNRHATATAPSHTLDLQTQGSNARPRFAEPHSALTPPAALQRAERPLLARLHPALDACCSSACALPLDSFRAATRGALTLTLTLTLTHPNPYLNPDQLLGGARPRGERVPRAARHDALPPLRDARDARPRHARRVRGAALLVLTLTLTRVVDLTLTLTSNHNPNLDPDRNPKQVQRYCNAFFALMLQDNP